MAISVQTRKIGPLVSRVGVKVVVGRGIDCEGAGGLGERRARMLNRDILRTEMLSDEC